ncbi:alpha/beta-hydrolase [Meredithblackwellia eburnea MCA 4105]
MLSRLSLAQVALIATAWLDLASSAQAALSFTQVTSSADYPYTVHQPTDADDKPPVVFFLHGSGAKAYASSLGENVFWDGCGYLLRQYSSGAQTSGPAATISQKYLTVLPLMPPTDMDWDGSKVMTVVNQVLSKYSYDPTRVYVLGYSRGGWGAWRTAFASPSTFAAIVPSAGSGGSSDSDLQKLIDNKVAVWAFGGSNDEKVANSQVQAQIAQMKALPNAGSDDIKVSTVQGADHGKMGTEPFTDADTWSWLASQVRGGGSSSSTTSTSTKSTIVTPTSTSEPSSTSISAVAANAVKPTTSSTSSKKKSSSKSCPAGKRMKRRVKKRSPSPAPAPAPAPNPVVAIPVAPVHANRPRSWAPAHGVPPMLKMRRV